jgi:pimeloyl-ACP methyl ester carboxylesterase
MRLLPVALLLFTASAFGSTPQQSSSPAGETTWVTANGLRLKTKIFRSARPGDRPVLIAILHGDLLAPGPAPSYHYAFAGKATERMDGVIAAAMLRPGYADDANDRSGGERGRRTGDNYTPEVVDAMAQAIRQLQTKFHPRATVLVGHSGGAAIAGDLLGRYPSEVNAALLVSCVCDVPAWRKHMVKYEFREVGPFSLLFLAPVRSLSPVDLAPRVPPSTRVRMVVGGEDPVAPPYLTQGYAAALRGHGVDAAVTIAPGLGHEILLEPVVLKQLQNLVQTVEEDVATRRFH